jgi:hypothetical protein
MFALMMEVVKGEISHQEAQQRVAYDCWLQRCETGAQGDALSDWFQAARLLNREADMYSLAVGW